MNPLELEVAGLAEAQARLVRLAEEVAASGGLRAVMAKGTLRAHAYSTKIVHVISGRLKNSLFPRVQVQGNQVYGVVGTNVAYAPIEEARGGTHAFFGRTVKEDGQGLVEMMEADLKAAARRANG